MQNKQKLVYRNVTLTQLIYSLKEKGWNEQCVSISVSYWRKLVFQGDLLGSIYTNTKDIWKRVTFHQKSSRISWRKQKSVIIE